MEAKELKAAIMELGTEENLDAWIFDSRERIECWDVDENMLVERQEDWFSGQPIHRGAGPIAGGLDKVDEHGGLLATLKRETDGRNKTRQVADVDVKGGGGALSRLDHHQPCFRNATLWNGAPPLQLERSAQTRPGTPFPAKKQCRHPVSFRFDHKQQIPQQARHPVSRFAHK